MYFTRTENLFTLLEMQLAEVYQQVQIAVLYVCVNFTTAFPRVCVRFEISSVSEFIARRWRHGQLAAPPKNFETLCLIYGPVRMSTRFTNVSRLLYCSLALGQEFLFSFNSPSFWRGRRWDLRLPPDAAAPYLINFYDLLRNENEFVIYLSFFAEQFAALILASK